MIFARVLLSALIGVFNYSGRSDRLEHWTFTLLTAILGGGGFLWVFQGKPVTPALMWVGLIVGTWFVLAHIALFVRRFHDHDRSGFWLLIPLFGLNIMLIAWVGQKGMLFDTQQIFIDYGKWIMLGGRAFTSLSVMGVLMPVFVGQGDEGDNRFGEPVE